MSMSDSVPHCQKIASWPLHALKLGKEADTDPSQIPKSQLVSLYMFLGRTSSQVLIRLLLN